MVVIDEADAALGDRDSEGDAGTSSRVFGMIATQMGDTRYRGRILWMLLTARPDLLPIDIKRQGRAEVHIPLFYPFEDDELQRMFVMLAKKLGTTLKPEDVPKIPQKGMLSGADIEGIVGRAWRKSLLAGQTSITPEALAEVVSQFLPSTQGLEKELTGDSRDDRVHRSRVPSASRSSSEWRRPAGAVRCKNASLRSSSSSRRCRGLSSPARDCVKTHSSE